MHFLCHRNAIQYKAKTKFNSHVFIGNGNVNLKESFNFAGNLNLLFTHSTYLKPAKAHDKEEEAAKKEKN